MWSPLSMATHERFRTDNRTSIQTPPDAPDKIIKNEEGKEAKLPHFKVIKIPALACYDKYHLFVYLSVITGESLEL